MKTFEDILHEINGKNDKIVFTSSDISNILGAFDKWQLCQQQEETKKEVIKLINKDDIQSFTYNPNYIDKSKYNNAFHPPFGYQSGFSLLTIVFKKR